jgi:hypothetical protein
MTVCDETSALGKHTGCPQASVKQKRHGVPVLLISRIVREPQAGAGASSSAG